MSRGAFFWGLVLIAVGGIFLLNNMGVIEVNLWIVIGPTFLVLLGLWILISPLMESGKIDKLSIPMENVSGARLEINFGAGRLKIRSGVGTNQLLEGDFKGGVETHINQRGNMLDGKLSLPVHIFPFFWWPDHFEWSFTLNNQIPLLLEMNVGAAESNLDFSDLLVNELVLHTGASSTDLTLPGHAGISKCSISAGAAGVKISVPQGVAARIRGSVGLGALNVDVTRFPRSGNEYLSPDYLTSPNKIDINVETGLGSVDIK